MKKGVKKTITPNKQIASALFMDASGIYSCGFPKKLKIGQIAKEANIPIVPACGDAIFSTTPGIPMAKTRTTLSPPIMDAIAPVLLTFLLKSPQINDPKKVAPKAPHDIPKIATIVSGGLMAIPAEMITKTALPTLISVVKFLSETFLLINPL